MSDQKTMSDLEKVFAAGDAWLLKYGIVSPIAHNNIVANLYVNFPQIKYLEYFMPDPAMYPDRREIEIVVYLGLWRMVFSNKDKLIDGIMDLIKEYLHDYKVTVSVKRYKRPSKANT